MKDPSTQIRRTKSEIRDCRFVGQASRLSPSSKSYNRTARWLQKHGNISLRRVEEVSDRRDARPTGWLQTCWLSLLCCLVISVQAATNSAPADDLFRLNPPHAELPPSFWEQYGTWSVMAALFLLTLVAAALWLILRPKPSIPVLIEILTRRELEVLSQRNEDGQVLSQVSRVLRRYVAGAFELPPDELTTSEFCQAIAGHEEIGPDLAVRVGEFLRRCDELKFAPATSPTPVCAAARAMELVELGEARRAHLRKLEAEPAQEQPATRT